MMLRRLPMSTSRWLATAASIVLSSLLLSGCGSPEEKAQAYYQSGMALIEKQDDLNARVELLKAVKYKSDKVEVWRALAGIDERTKAQSLFLDLRRIVELDPNDLGARLKLVRIMVSGGAAEAALKVLDVATEGDKPNSELHAVRAIALLRNKDTQGAVREARRAVEIDASNSEALTLLAAKALSDGDADGALKLLGAVKVTPADEARVTVLRAQAFEKKGDLKQVEGLLKTLVTLDPETYQESWLRFLLSQRRFDDAEKVLRTRATAHPGDSKFELELVRFLASARGPDAARSELESRIKAGGEVFDYQLALAELNFAQGNAADAVQALQALAANASPPERKLSAQVKLAEMYVAKSNLAAAEPLIAGILAKDRRNSGALRLRAGIAVSRGQFDSAVADLREALNDEPKSVDLLMALALAYERGDKNELADRQYADALRSSEFNPEVVLRYVAFLQRRKDLSRAEDILAEAAGRTPGNLQVLSSLAQIRLARQNWAGAMALAETIGHVNGGSVLADEVRASALAGQNKIEESVAALEQARRASPDAVAPLVALVSAYARAKNFDKALAVLSEARQKNPDNAQLLVMLGKVELAQNKERDAINHFKEAIARQPKDAAGYTALSDLYDSQKKYDAAEEVIQAALKQMPDNLNFRLALAGVKLLRPDYEAAIAQYEAILRDQPTSVVATNNLVSLLLDYRTDQQSLDRAVTLSQSLKGTALPSLKDTLGWAQYRSGDYKSAIATLEDVVAAVPNLAVARYHLGMSYKAAGQADKAADQLKTALNLEPDGTELKDRIRTAIQ